VISKTGVGTGSYVYPASGAGAVRPHAVQSIPGLGSYDYDGDGNLTSAPNGAVLSWKSFDMPDTITRAGVSSQFAYGSEHQRARQTRSDGTVLYYAGAMEVEVASGVSTVKTYWPQGLGVEIDKGSLPTELLWTHADRLGSVIALTTGTGVFKEKLAYDAWGKRRTTDGSATPDTLDGQADNKGFTGHEMLDNLDMVHMNGRIYEPAIARFLSADPIVQDPEHSQSYNRYSYVWNNPANLTDPTGFQAVGDTNQPRRDKPSMTLAASNTREIWVPLKDQDGNVVGYLVFPDNGASTKGSATSSGKETTSLPAPKEGAAKGAAIRTLDRAWEKAVSAGDVAGMQATFDRYVALAGDDPSSAMHVVAWGSALTRARADAGMGSPEYGTLAAMATAGFAAGMSGNGPSPAAKEADVALRSLNPKSLIGRQGPSEMTGSKVERFKKAMKADGYGNFPPIEAANAEGRLIIIDGHHRAAAAARAGLREVPVNVRNVSSEEASQLMREAAEAMSRRY